MKLLATLCNNKINPKNLIAIVNPWSGEVKIASTPIPTPTSINGICKTEFGYLAGVIPTGRDNPSALWFLDHNLISRRFEIIPEILDVHSIVHYYDCFYLVVSTRNNSIVQMYIREDEVDVDQIYYVSEDQYDRFHLNSIAIDEELRIFVSSLGDRKNKDQLWHYRMSGGRIFNLKTWEDYAANASHPHSIKFLGPGGPLVYCDSGNNSLIRENGTGVELDGYTRGLVFDDNYFYVGVSTVRSYSISTGACYNDKSPGFYEPGIWIIRRDNGEKVKKIRMDHVCSEIYDLEWAWLEHE